MTDYTNAQLTALYNKLATQLEIPTIAIWKGKKETIISRIEELQVRVSALRHHDRYEKKKASKKVAKEKLIADIIEVPTIKPQALDASALYPSDEPVEDVPFKEVSVASKIKPLAQGSKVDPVLVTYLEGAPKAQKPAVTLRDALAKFPGVTRIQFKHSAIAAGFNGLTARNMFDKVNKK